MRFNTLKTRTEPHDNTGATPLRWRRPLTAALALGLSLGAALPTTQAQAADDYPSQAVQFIVPWSPGGGSDTLMRVVSNHIEPYLGQPMPIINQPGVSGTLGLKQLSRKDADGYTVGQVHEGLLVSHDTGLTALNHDDFAPVAAMTSSPQYLVVNADSPWQNWDDFVTYAKAHPGEIRMGVTLGGVPHVDAAMIEDAGNLQFHYVGFEGTGARIRALVGGHIDAAIGDISSSLEFVRNGDLRFLAVGSDERLERTPDVPTFKELGEDIELNVVRGIVAPKGTPDARIETLAQALKRESQDEAFIEGLHNAGAEVRYMGPEAYGDYLAETDDTFNRLSGKLKK
ncbi:tripartite-type tricarboxylate transporter receptor subunit TctC [Kushneria sinocarnis]|uniref:Tripartite-type tricarboxylate transporter receptor subunit TctC n=1 Tax=Kushneria sinocarnis TaxID=595502 RepID=A0A420WZX4_9GAMM|nr:tripartite tricarboxylate transporter substrate binding protein [Kushneria sinocarnis]RKR06755.1 tripartite-type tricarboxylate transporter receptor subunit TctC [Kushneria sinocarnis]